MLVRSQEIFSGEKKGKAFEIVSVVAVTPVVYDPQDDSLVRLAAQFFCSDIEMVTGKKPELLTTLPSGKIILAGTAQSKWIRQLVKERKVNFKSITGQWEAYQVVVVKNPFENIEEALVIVGSDRRGTAYGIFELSRQMGVSPWYWWADVPVKKKKTLYINELATLSDAPKVKYRGIFINDEAPALSNWSREKFGGFNHHFYEKVFELMLRLKSNYLWPAMWGNAFYDDDLKNIESAKLYGIVIGTSHHEPLMRAHDEWRRYGKGKWNYDSNQLQLQSFWKGGLQRASNEKIVSIGMRGDGDEPMSRETATALLEKIVKDQRQIIKEVSGKPAAQTPQLWALYKEVQDYYDQGMRVPDDVTLLLCDDNWGNIRRLPRPGSKKRAGGYGIYYHFDYVGGPRNYKWINTNNIARVWEQMNLAYQHGVDRIWIVNVGDIKPMELPISFFLDYAWNPEKLKAEDLPSYYEQWAKQQFGKDAGSTGKILARYAQLSARRKPELLDAKTYSLTSYNEWTRVVNEWMELETEASAIYETLSANTRDAYFQLVLHPIRAMANLHQMYHATALNHDYAAKNHPLANTYAERVRHLYLNDSLITKTYHELGKGKWNHMMSQTHIGYTYWQQPPVNKMPALHILPFQEIKTNPKLTFKDVESTPIPEGVNGKVFYEEENTVSMEASNYSFLQNSGGISWQKIPGIGRTGDGMTTVPVTARVELTANSPYLAYEFYTNRTGPATLQLYFSPTLNIYNNEGLQFAVSIDDEKPVVISLNKEDNQQGIWNRWVAENIIIKSSAHQVNEPGKHILKYWMISPAVILQKAVINLGGLEPSYLGPTETLKLIPGK
ncbi:MAG: glycosyl hydrolase 115 family protein [Flavisolibacter sp.]